jgi:hypothetical protein
MQEPAGYDSSQLAPELSVFDDTGGVPRLLP